MTETDPSNHFSADEDWKSEAEAEQARLAEADAKAAASEQPPILRPRSSTSSLLSPRKP